MHGIRSATCLLAGLTGLVCSGSDGVGERCNIEAAARFGFSAQCEVPVEGDPDIGTAPTICRACGRRGLKCCDDQVAGVLQYFYQHLQCTSMLGVCTLATPLYPLSLIHI